MACYCDIDDRGSQEFTRTRDFSHTRVGRHGKPFTLYKLRTMYQETAQGPTHVVGSATVTSIGPLLRRSKLDELPQLVNVLKGEMSLVGPRPCLPIQHELIAARKRVAALSVRPGITGLAQVNSVDMSDVAKIAALDGEYTHNHNLVEDLRIILLTIGGCGRGVDAAAKLHTKG